MQRNSVKRDAILKKICSTKSHPTAEWVYGELKGEFPDLSLGTVYRNIAEFKSAGKLVSVGVVAGKDRLDGCVSEHSHFICDACHAVIDIDIAPRPLAIDAGRAERMNLSIHGTCRNCL